MPSDHQGRWPANVILSPGMAEVLDEQSGPRGAHGGGAGEPVTHAHAAFGEGSTIGNSRGQDYGDSGGASRFFLQAGYEPWELEWILANGLVPCGWTV